MAGVAEEEVLLAARILTTFSCRPLVGFPEWVDPELATATAASWVTRRQRTGGRRRSAVEAASRGTGYAASSCAAEGERGTARPAAGVVLVESETSARYAAAPDGFAPSTSGGAGQPKPTPAGLCPEKTGFASPPKHSATVSSPETPLEFGASATGSGASLSADDGGQPAAKRAAPAASGSGDEGCSSPAKRTRLVDAGDGSKPAAEEKAISLEPKMEDNQEPSSNGQQKRGLDFDLNFPLPDDFWNC